MRFLGGLLALLLVQIALGLANVHLALPLANALAHNLVAAHLLVCCVLARGRLSAPAFPFAVA